MNRTGEADRRAGFSNSTARLATTIVAGTTVTLLLLAGRAVAQPVKTVWDGVFTTEQAARGQGGYQKACGSCHGAGLEGDGFAPPLVGEPFTDRWRAGSVGDFLLIVKATMPQDRPGSLSADAYADIVAYVLKMNNYPAGASELGQDPDQYKSVPFSRLARDRSPEPEARQASNADLNPGHSKRRLLAGREIPISDRHTAPGNSVAVPESASHQSPPTGHDR